MCSNGMLNKFISKTIQNYLINLPLLNKEYDMNCAQFASKIKPVGISGLKIEKKPTLYVTKISSDLTVDEDILQRFMPFTIIRNFFKGFKKQNVYNGNPFTCRFNDVSYQRIHTQKRDVESLGNYNKTSLTFLSYSHHNLHTLELVQ